MNNGQTVTDLTRRFKVWYKNAETSGCLEADTLDDALLYVIRLKALGYKAKIRPKKR